jgi:7-cyano-7-deazaguanine synthase
MRDVLVLFSGGIDSTACLSYYLLNGYSPCAMWVDYGQVARVPELNAAKAVTAHLGVPLKIVKVQGLQWFLEKSGDEFRGRNLFLGSIGVGSFPSSHGLIAMGIHEGTNYRDCSIEFQTEIDTLVRTVSDGHLAMDFPFGELTKVDIAAFCKKTDVPTNLTYSCLRGLDPPCGHCVGCKDRREVISYENTSI